MINLNEQLNLNNIEQNVGPRTNRQCTIKMKINVIIIGTIFITGMIIFIVTMTTPSLSNDGNLKYISLGIAMGSILVGIIIHGILEMHEINRQHQQNLENFQNIRV